jgi:hypothetical protein
MLYARHESPNQPHTHQPNSLCQGTNAHVILQAATRPHRPSHAQPGRAALAWRRAHTWAVPTPRLLIAEALPAAASRLSMACRLDGAVAAWLRDNIIGGAPWLPTSAVLELAAEAVALAVAGGGALVPAGGGDPAAHGGAQGGGSVAFAGCVFPAGLPLSQGGGGFAADVRAALDVGTGLVEVEARGARSGGGEDARIPLLVATLALVAADP